MTLNGIKCKQCGDVIVSYSQHDYKTCSCGLVFVDGGPCYRRYGGDHTKIQVFLDDYLEMYGFQTIEESIMFNVYDVIFKAETTYDKLYTWEEVDASKFDNGRWNNLVPPCKIYRWRAGPKPIEGELLDGSIWIKP